MKKSTFHRSKKQVLNAVKQAAKNLDLEIQNKSEIKGTLQLYSNGGLFSYGNRIDVELTETESSRVIVKVLSESSAAIQLIDWGTNDRLEKNLIEEVKNILNG